MDLGIPIMLYLLEQNFIKQDTEILLADFRSDLAMILGCRAHTTGGKGVPSNAISGNESCETQVPAKRRKKDEEDDNIATQLSMCVLDNWVCTKKLKHLIQQKLQR